MTMRRTLAISLVMAATLATACGKKADAPAAPAAKDGAKAAAEAPAKAPEPVEVVLWHAYREGEKAALEAIVEHYNGLNQGVRVRLLNVPYDAFVDKVTIATPRGQGPDLFIFAHNMLGEWVDRVHLLEPISEKVAPETLKRFIPQTVKALVYKQSLYGLPLAFKSLALFVNPDLVKAIPDTAEALVAAAKAATDKGAGRYGLAYEASLLYFNAPFIHGFGGVVLDEAGKPQVGSKPFAEALAWVRGLYKAGVLPSGISSAMVTSLFNEGKAAMVVSGPWFLGEIAKDRAYEVTLLPTMPGGNRAQPFLGSEAVFLSAFSQHKAEALRVMDFLTSDESAVVRLQKGRQTVANAAVYDREDVKGDRVVQAFRAQAENSVLMPSRPEMQAVWSTLDMAINRSVFGDVDPAKALAEAQAKVEADLAKMAH
jgi:arabinogalactan oligomer / maltooligosaccharide transport system substrate-binding protein